MSWICKNCSLVWFHEKMGYGLTTAADSHHGKRFVVDIDGKVMAGKTVANRQQEDKMYVRIGGVQQLTKKQMLSIQEHYGAAIRKNNDVNSMRRAIWDIFTIAVETMLPVLSGSPYKHGSIVLSATSSCQYSNSSRAQFLRNVYTMVHKMPTRPITI